MQPFDALSIRAVLQESKPLLLNRKVDKVHQLARDEILINLRSKGGAVSLFMSAQSVYGRMCLVRIPSGKDSPKEPGEKSVFDRYKSKYGTNTPPNFCIVLRRHLTGATLIGIEQIPGERIVDFVFSCTDEVGGTSIKVLTAEIMGRHSNLIFWDKDSKKILAASHVVTKEMSRQREVLPNLLYERPPGQDRPNIFLLEDNQIKEALAALHAHAEKSEDVEVEVEAAPSGKKPRPVVTLEQWLLTTFTGLGKHLCEEVIAATGLDNEIKNLPNQKNADEILLEKIKQLKDCDSFAPEMMTDLSRYSLLGWYAKADASAWQSYPTVNELVENYFRSLEAREHYMQLREKIKSEINAEATKLEARKSIASSHLSDGEELEKLKTTGDMILSNLHEIQPGQTILELDSWTADNGGKVEVELNPNLSSVQNAQSYYRKYAKARARRGAAQSTISEVDKRLFILNDLLAKAEQAPEISDLRRIKDTLAGRKHQETKKPDSSKSKSRGNKPRLVSLISSDGWTIYVGRNKNENDQLISKVANPNDLWFHVLGKGGAHVLVRVTATKQDPPKATMEEAAQVAARLSKSAAGAKVRVIYTRCKHVKKVDKKKPGLVRYENERTLEVDTAKPMPKLMKKLFK